MSSIYSLVKTAKSIREYMWQIGLRSSSSRDEIEKIRKLCFVLI